MDCWPLLHVLAVLPTVAADSLAGSAGCGSRSRVGARCGEAGMTGPVLWAWRWLRGRLGPRLGRRRRSRAREVHAGGPVAAILALAAVLMPLRWRRGAAQDSRLPFLVIWGGRGARVELGQVRSRWAVGRGLRGGARKHTRAPNSHTMNGEEGGREVSRWGIRWVICAKQATHVKGG